MTGLLASLTVGLSIIGVLFFLLYRFTPLRGGQITLLIILLVFAIYIPYSILNWPGADVFAVHLALFVTLPYGLGIITSSREKYLASLSSDELQNRKWFHWGPALIIGFFCFVVAINAVFVTLAERGLEPGVAAAVLPPARTATVTSFFPGAVSHDFQEKESQYNVYVNEYKEQRERGWQVNKGWLFEPYAGVANNFQVGVQDKDGAPISKAKVSVGFYRASDSRLDQEFELKEEGRGIYRVPVKLDQPGSWQVVIRITRDDQQHEIRADTTLEIAPNA